MNPSGYVNISNNYPGVICKSILLQNALYLWRMLERRPASHIGLKTSTIIAINFYFWSRHLD